MSDTAARYSETNQGTASRTQPNRFALFDLIAIAAVAAVLGLAAGRLYFTNHPTLSATVRQFHLLYYNTAENTWLNTRWLGVAAEKTPQDMWIYQEIMYETRPDVLVEAGTADGGSAYYFATIFGALGHGRVITIDVEDKPNRPKHDRINYLLGSSTSHEIVTKLKTLIAPGERVMVSLDSDHRMSHVARELQIYGDLVTPGCYMVVEDTNVNGHPVRPNFGPGPMEAVRMFLAHDNRFAIDHAREKFAVTFFPDGWLRRVR